MNCERYTPLISAALDGALTQEEQELLEAHLRQCPDCRALMEQLMAQDQLLEELNEEPPARLKSRVMEQVHTHPRRARPAQRSLWKRWGALAAALVLVVAGSTALPQLAGEEAAPQASSASLAEGTPRVDDRVVPFDMQEEGDAAVQPNLATQETASDFSPEQALELVVDRVSADSGYERTLALDGDACRITLTDGDTVIDESAVEYLGLSDNGEYYLFRWTWEGQTDEEADWYRYAVPLDGSAVIWRGESLPESTDFDQMLVQ